MLSVRCQAVGMKAARWLERWDQEVRSSAGGLDNECQVMYRWVFRG